MPDKAKTPSETLTQLRQNLAQHFNREELRTLCLDLGIEHENLPDAKGSMAQELVAHLGHQGWSLIRRQGIYFDPPGSLAKGRVRGVQSLLALIELFADDRRLGKVCLHFDILLLDGLKSPAFDQKAGAFGAQLTGLLIQ